MIAQPGGTARKLKKLSHVAWEVPVLVSEDEWPPRKTKAFAATSFLSFLGLKGDVQSSFQWPFMPQFAQRVIFLSSAMGSLRLKPVGRTDLEEESSKCLLSFFRTLLRALFSAQVLLALALPVC